MVMGIEHTWDDDPREEISTMFADANLLVEDRFQRAHHGEEIIGESPALKDVLSQMEVVAPTDATVLLHGETGLPSITAGFNGYSPAITSPPRRCSAIINEPVKRPRPYAFSAADGPV